MTAAHIRAVVQAEVQRLIQDPVQQIRALTDKVNVLETTLLTRVANMETRLDTSSLHADVSDLKQQVESLAMQMAILERRFATPLACSPEGSVSSVRPPSAHPSDASWDVAGPHQ